MNLKFGKRTLFITLFTVLAALCMALAFFFLLPSSKTQASAEGNDHSHDDGNWSKLSSSKSQSLSTGSYYLTGDIETNITIKSGETVTICLSGYTLTASKSSKVAIEVGEGATFTLCDCSGNNSGKITGVSRRSTLPTAKGGKSGGGIYVNSKATFYMYGGTISGNTAKCGGGVYVGSGATFTMYDGVISGNTIGGESNDDPNGSGVYVYDGTFIMNGGTISDNTVKAAVGNYDYVYGGAVYVKSGTFTMTGGTISDNEGKWVNIWAGRSCGGGVYVFYGSTFNMEGGTISNNQSANGGGVYVDSSSTFTMDGGTISGNYTDKQDGGGVYVAGTFIMNGGTISNNSAKASRNNSNAHHLGGGVYVSGGDFTLNGGTITGNSAGWGGALYVKGGTFTMNDGTIAGNTSYQGSDDIQFSSGTFILNGGFLDTTVNRDYSSLTVSGGYLSESAYAILSKYLSDGYVGVTTGYSTYVYAIVKESDYEISHSAHDGITYENLITKKGGAILAGSYYLGSDVTLESNITISSGTVYLCLNGYTLTGNGSGSVITVEDGAALILCDCSEEETGTITGGSTYNGGGINVSSGGALIMNSGTIKGNTASNDGGGVYVAGKFTMNGGTITGNTASNDGGGVDVYRGTFVMNGGTITGNTATSGGNVNVNRDSTFTMNDGTISDGGVYIYMGTASIEGGAISTQIWNNRGTLTLNDGYFSGTYGNNYGTLTVNGGYFNETAYTSFSGSISDESSAINLEEFYSIFGGTQLYSTYSIEYPYAVFSKGDYSIDNVTVTYGDSYSVTVKGTYTSVQVIYSYSYDGVKYEGIKLPTIAGKYEVTATILAVSKDGTIDTSTVTFAIVIQPKTLTNSMFSITGSYVYNGTEQKADYTFEDTDYDGAELTENDFDVLYSSDATGAGTVYVTFTGKGNYDGTVTLEYEIEKADYDMSGVSLTNLIVTYSGSQQSLQISGTPPTGVSVEYYYEGTNGTEYGITTTAPTNAGYYIVIAVFSGDDNHNSISKLTADLTIEKASYETTSLTLEDVTVTYDGEEHAVTVTGLPEGVEATVYYAGTFSTDYDKTVYAPTDAGTYAVTAVFSGDFDNYNSIDDLTANLTIEKATVSEEAVQSLKITVKIGASLEDIELPEGWEWSSATTFSSSGDYVVYATYSADDNYETVTTAVKVSVTGYSTSDKLGIAGIAIGCVAFVAFVSVLILFFRKKKEEV